MKNILMPKLSDTMTEGLLGSWLKSVGDPISRGDIIAEVETDKATMGLEAFDDGILLEQRVRPGEVVPVGTVLGVMGQAQERGEIPAAEPVSADPATPPEPAAPPVETSPPQAPPTSFAGDKASPVVRRRARELGIDLEKVRGSGPQGRVLLEDLAAGGASPRPEPLPVETPPPIDETRHQRMREAIAATVTRSWNEIPHIFVTMDVIMDNAEEVRRELQVSGTPVSVNDLVLKGVAVALLSAPDLNGSYADNRLSISREINLGMAVNIADGLLVPVLKGAQNLTLGEIATRSRQLVELARSGRIAPADLEGGTFSVSNLGPYGVSQFTALIAPPQVAMLAVGAICETIIPKNGEAVLGKVMKLTLSADHRAVDGAYGAAFLRELKSVLENPVRLLI
jgi:pyruvate dehydrogenase E2 component (dihydrolipoamide acetyltransferase)